jgi:hypothetical protein
MIPYFNYLDIAQDGISRCRSFVACLLYIILEFAIFPTVVPKGRDLFKK